MKTATKVEISPYFLVDTQAWLVSSLVCKELAELHLCTLVCLVCLVSPNTAMSGWSNVVAQSPCGD